MKKALTLFVFVLGTAAFANTDDSFYPVPNVDNHETLGAKKGTGKIVKAQEPSKAAAFKEAEQPKEKPHKATATSKVCSTPERSTFGITGYFVDFVHKSNVKLVNMLLD